MGVSPGVSGGLSSCREMWIWIERGREIKVGDKPFQFVNSSLSFFPYDSSQTLFLVLFQIKSDVWFVQMVSSQTRTTARAPTHYATAVWCSVGKIPLFAHPGITWRFSFLILTPLHIRTTPPPPTHSSVHPNNMWPTSQIASVPACGVFILSAFSTCSSSSYRSFEMGPFQTLVSLVRVI
jgi:hypothetical protein